MPERGQRQTKEAKGVKAPSAASGLRGQTASPDSYRALLDCMTEGVSLAREDGTIVYTNPAEDRMFGYEPGELIGRHVSVQNAHSPKDNERIVAELIAEFGRAGAWRGERLNRRKDGSVFITTARITAVEIDGERHWLCVQEDVSVEKAAITALHDSEARLEIATAAAEIGIWDWDVLTGRLVYSPRAKEICGLPLDQEVTIEDARRVTHPEDHPLTRAQARRALDPEIREDRPFEYRILRPDGAVRWVFARGRAIFAEVEGRQKAVRFLGTIQDITERRRLEEAERFAAQRLRVAIDAGRMAVWEVDLVRDELAGSPELNRLLGFPEDSTPTLDLVQSGYFPGEGERLRAVAGELIARKEQFIEAEFRYRTPGGSERWLLLRSEILYDGKGNATRALGVLTDITERKKIEADLRALTETLEARVEERTAELAAMNRMLTAQIEEREKVEATLGRMQRLEALGQLTAGIAHDFNNLLTVVLGSVRFFEREMVKYGTDAKTLERLGYMRAAAERGATLTAQLLAFSRQQRLEPKRVVLNDIIVGMDHLLKSSIGGAVRVTTDLEPALWSALADSTQVELAVLNLAINARDAMEVGGSLFIKTANVTLEEPGSPEEPPRGDYVMLAVSDGGVGMPDEVLARAFEPFFTTKPVGKGSGLGLAQVYGFARQSGGGVRIETRLGEGTTVKIHLPRAMAELHQTAITPSGAEHGALAPGQTRRVLLVDDDGAVRRVTAELLEEIGYTVVQADSGRSALRLIDQDQRALDLMIVDFAMRGMNGVDVAREFAARRPDTPILFVTGYAELDALVGVEPDRIVRKPLRPDDLAAKAHRALCGAGRTGPQAT